jgi:hypothetical protein
MSMTTRILSATTALFAASTLYLAWAVGVERDRGADFRTSHGAVAGAADSRTTAPENGATAVTDAEGSGRSSETPTAESPGLFDRLGGLVGGGMKRASRQQQDELFQKDFLRMFSDPATRKQLVEERIPSYRDQFIVLERQLDMPSDQWQRFLETVATQAIERRGGSAVCGRDVQCQMRSLGPEAYARYDQEIRDVLGDADMKQYQTFNYALSERQSVESLQAELSLSQQLSEKAAEDLIDSLSEVRRAAEKSIEEQNGSFFTFRGDGYVVVFPSNLKSLDERLNYAAGHFKKLRERAEPFLNPVQLATYQAQLKGALRRLRREMAATPELF